ADGHNVDDQVAQAIIFTVRPEHRKEAIDLLEAAAKCRSPTDRERFLLARAYEINGNWAAARRQLGPLVAADRPEPRFVAYYIAALVNHGEASEAQQWLDRLETVAGGSARTVELKAKVLHAAGQNAEAVEALQNYAKAHSGEEDIRV